MSSGLRHGGDIQAQWKELKPAARQTAHQNHPLSAFQPKHDNLASSRHRLGPAALGKVTLPTLWRANYVTSVHATQKLAAPSHNEVVLRRTHGLPHRGCWWSSQCPPRGRLRTSRAQTQRIWGWGRRPWCRSPGKSRFPAACIPCWREDTDAVGPDVSCLKFHHCNR